MSRIKTEELLDRIASGNFKTIKLSAVNSNCFIMMLENTDGTFIHEDAHGNMKEYPKADHALTWLKRMTNLNEIVVDIGLWRNNS